MKHGIKKFTTATMMAGLGLAAWSPATHACSAMPYMASVCVMAVSTPGYTNGFGNGTYMLAAGQTLGMQQYAAMFALLGTTYGSNGPNTFKLPDLRGRVVVGYDNTTGASPVGTSAGATTVTLSVAQLPSHTVQLANVVVPVAGITATTTLSGLAATANLSNLTLTGAATGLRINAASANSTTGGNPDNAYLGKGPGSQGYVYTSQAPNVQLNEGSITGTLTHVLGPNITAPVNFGTGGGATTTLAGNLTFNATSAAVGGGMPVSTMQPYLVLPYFIAMIGEFPTQN